VCSKYFEEGLMARVMVQEFPTSSMIPCTHLQPKLGKIFIDHTIVKKKHINSFAGIKDMR